MIDTTGAVCYNAAVLPAGNFPKDVEGGTRGSELQRLRATGARPWPECYEAIFKLLARANTVCAYNAAHEQRVLNQTSIRYGLEFPPIVRWRCLMMDYAAHRQIPQSSGGWRWLKLEEAAAHEGALRRRQAHEALPDCHLTLSLMRAVVGEGTTADTTDAGTPELEPWDWRHKLGFVGLMMVLLWTKIMWGC